MYRTFSYVCYYVRTVRTKKATRRGNKSVITKCINEAKDLLDNYENINESITSVTKDKHVERSSSSRLKVVKEYDEEIRQLCKVKEIVNEIEIAEEINSRVLDFKKLIYNFLRRKKYPIR